MRKKTRIRKDLSMGRDMRGDECLFVEEEHLTDDNTMDFHVLMFTYIHIIRDGTETHRTGYMEDNEVVKWD